MKELPELSVWPVSNPDISFKIYDRLIELIMLTFHFIADSVFQELAHQLQLKRNYVLDVNGGYRM